MNPDERAKLMAAASDDRALLLAKSPPRPCAGTNRGVRTNIDCPLARHHRGWKGPRSMKVCSKGSATWPRFDISIRFVVVSFAARGSDRVNVIILERAEGLLVTADGRNALVASQQLSVHQVAGERRWLPNHTSSLDLKTECRHTKT